MKTLNYPTQDYDYRTYFKLEGNAGAFYLFPDEADLRADYAEYNEAEQDFMDSLEPLTDGEWVVIDGKEYVTVINSNDFDRPARFIPADSMPYMQMDGAGVLHVNGHCLNVTINMDGDLDEKALRQALRTAQLEGHIPAHCEFILNDGGGLEKIGE